MIDTVDVSAGRRRAALTLHALAVPDREWLLAQLPTAHRTALRGLLDELHELGIPADAAVIRAALAEATPAVPLPHAKGLAQVLARETESFRGVLLSLLPASQKDVVLSHWPLALEATPAPVDKPSWTPRLQEAMLKSWQDLAASQEVQP